MVSLAITGLMTFFVLVLPQEAQRRAKTSNGRRDATAAPRAERRPARLGAPEAHPVQFPDIEGLPRS